MNADEKQGTPPDAVAPPLTVHNMSAHVETAIQIAMRQGVFDNLTGAGKPIEGLGTHHDPDWWLRRKIETEKLTGLGPPAILLRTEDRGLDEKLDALSREQEVRERIEDFNRRVIEARRQLMGGPPVVTQTRDVEAELVAWRTRRAARTVSAPDATPDAGRTRRRWFGRIVTDRGA